jgi:peptidoglycan/LPS O-acetylase OafA/YrhL
MDSARPNRLAYVDNLRLLLIVLVLGTHSAITYSGLGAWYYTQPLPLGAASRFFFLMLEVYFQAFFMDALFLLAGYFAAASLSKRGAGEFATGRLFRLGVPTLFYMVCIHPLTGYYLARFPAAQAHGSFAAYYFAYLAGGRVLAGTGPMWFALALLVFSLALAAARAWLGGLSLERGPRPVVPGLAGYLIAAISLAAFGLRLVWPIGTNVLNMQLCFFAGYVVMFGFGIAAYRFDWLRVLDYRLGRRFLLCGLCLWPVLGVLLIATGAVTGPLDPLLGGPHWQSAALCLWQSATGVCMSLGLAGVFREKANLSSPLLGTLSGSAFAVYVCHPPLLVALARLLDPVDLPAVPKFLLLYALAVPACFAVARQLTRVPVLGAMLRQ